MLYPGDILEMVESIDDSASRSQFIENNAVVSWNVKSFANELHTFVHVHDFFGECPYGRRPVCVDAHDYDKHVEMVIWVMKTNLLPPRYRNQEGRMFGYMFMPRVSLKSLQRVWFSVHWTQLARLQICSIRPKTNLRPTTGGLTPWNPQQLVT